MTRRELLGRVGMERNVRGALLLLALTLTTVDIDDVGRQQRWTTSIPVSVSLLFSIFTNE